MAHIETYTERGVPFQAWLYRIAHNLVANWHRDRGRRKVTLDELSPPVSSPNHRTGRRKITGTRGATTIRLLPSAAAGFAPSYLSNAKSATSWDAPKVVASLYHRTLIALRDEL
jgi:RNA polymerase sigma-70 factor (ECF subfamily)